MQMNCTISIADDITLLTFYNAYADIHFVSKVFKILEDEKINVDLITLSPPKSSQTDLSFTVSGDDFGRIMELSAKFRAIDAEMKIDVSSGNSKITVYSEDMPKRSGVASTVFAAAASVAADIRLITTSDVEISLLVTKANADATLRAIEKAFVS